MRHLILNTIFLPRQARDKLTNEETLRTNSFSAAFSAGLASAAVFPHHTHKEIDQGWFSDNQGTMQVTMFNAQWTQAYLDVLTRRVADDVFRCENLNERKTAAVFT